VKQASGESQAVARHPVLIAIPKTLAAKGFLALPSTIPEVLVWFPDFCLRF
jgi:hypothetical protein